MCLYRMMRTWTDVRCFCFILFVFVLLLPVTSQEQQGDPEPSSDETERAQIIPGKRIGRYVLCMEKKTLFKGKTRSEINEQLREEKIFPAFKEHGLRWVVTWNESHTTPNGLKVDSSVQ